MSNALVPVGELERMAEAVAASKLFGLVNKEQAFALMLVAQAEGLHPATAARDYHVIQGRPTLKADAMLGRYLNSGGSVEWHEHTDAKVSATFKHPQGGTLKIEWDMARAKAAELGGRDMWKKYPRQMLRARVISEGVRATNPNVAIGLYTPEEVGDFEPAGGPKGNKAKVVAEEVDEAYVKQSASDTVELIGMVDRAPDMDTLKKVGKEIAKRVGTMIPNDIAQLRGAYSGKEKALRNAYGTPGNGSVDESLK